MRPLLFSHARLAYDGYMADSAHAAAGDIDRSFSDRVEVDLFCLAYFPKEYAAFSPKETSLARISQVVQAHGEAEVRAKLERWLRHQDPGYIDRAASTQAHAPIALPDLDWVKLHPDAPFDQTTHIHNQRLAAKLLDGLRTSFALRLVSPMRQGKSWWRKWLVNRLKDDPSIRVLEVDFGTWSPMQTGDLKRLLKTLSAELQKQLRLDPEESSALAPEPTGMNEVWDAIRVWKQRPEHAATTLVLILDSLQQLEHTSAAQGLFAPLRALLQATPGVFVLLLMPALNSSPIYQSTWALGNIEQISDLTREQVLESARLYQQEQRIQEGISREVLWQLIGGNPYLNKVAFYAAAQCQNRSWAELLEEAVTCSDGGELFRHYFTALRQVIGAEHIKYLRNVYDGAVKEDTKYIDRNLLDWGITFYQSNAVKIRCPLYLQLLRRL